MESVVVVSAKRTPLGAFGGKFKSLSAVDLGAAAIKSVIENYKVKVDAVYMGCVLSAGLGQSAGRQAALAAGLPDDVNCSTINKICGSGMAAIMFAKNAILAGESEIVVAGGMENMSNAPYLLQKARFGYRLGDGKIIDHMVNDGLTDAYEKCHMGFYAEDTAKMYGFTKEDQDAYTVQSFFKARAAQENGWVKNEIAPVTVKEKKAETQVDTDEIPHSVNLEKMPNLKPVFKPDGTITAASASSISDGAAALLLMTESKAKELGLEPIAKIVAQSSFSQSPKLFTTAPIGAVKDVLKKSGWSLDEVDVWEINEAFAVVTMAAMKELSIDPEKINIFGGACALGHPLGASGARIVVTLINAMRFKKAKKGIATLCVGGGEGVALAISMD